MNTGACTHGTSYLLIPPCALDMCLHCWRFPPHKQCIGVSLYRMSLHSFRELSGAQVVVTVCEL